MPLRFVRPPTVPARTYLALLVLVLVLPLLVFGGVLLSRYARSEQDRRTAYAQSAVTRTADALDRELAGIQASLLVLADTPALVNGDLTAFAEQARRLVGVLGLNLVLTDPSGQQLLNANVPPGDALPPMRNTGPYKLTAQQRRPVVSDLMTGAVSGRPLLAVIVPVFRRGEVAYLLSLSLSPDRVRDILLQQGLPDGWNLVVVDSRHTVVGRSREHSRFLGRAASADLRENATAEQGSFYGQTLEGSAVLASYRKLRSADWRVALGVPTAMLDAPFRQAFWWLGAAFLLAVTTSAVLAMVVARRLTMPLGGLLDAAGLLASGRQVTPVTSRIRELDLVGRALADASDELHARNASLAREQARLAAVFDTVPVGLVLADAPESRVVASNPQFERILRHPVPQGDGAALAGLLSARHADGRRVLPEEHPLARAIRGEPAPDLECLYTRGDGTEAWIRVAAAPIRAANGAVTGGVAAVLDLDDLVRAREAMSRFAEDLERQVAERTAQLQNTLDRLREETAHRNLAEEQLRQAQKMEAVGRLTGGIAHDFNNLLTVVIGGLDLLRRRLPEGPDGKRQRRLVDSAMEAGQRAATLTARLLAFGRQQPLMPQSLDVNHLVAGMGDLLRSTLGEQVEVRTVLADGLWQAHADPNQLENALLNLAVNARDAIGDRMAGMDAAAPGRLTIETSNIVLDEAHAARNSDGSVGQFVVVAVSDTGTGMPPDVIARAFDPFFTTKPQGTGIGLGLSQVHGFVKQSGGHVSIESETRPGLGRGTTVRLYLPRFVPDTAAGTAPPSNEPSLGAGELVLVVEDQEAVRRLSTTALQELGYRVLEADRASTALRLLDANPDVVLLFTDVVLPETNGRRLAEEAKARHPGLRVLFTTGYARDTVGQDGQVDSGPDMVTKPFTLDRLAAKLREVLDRPA